MVWSHYRDNVSGHLRHSGGVCSTPLSPGGAGIAGRLVAVDESACVPPVQEASFAEKQRDRVRDTLASLGKLVPGDSKQTPRTQLLMMRAGYRSSRSSDGHARRQDC